MGILRKKDDICTRVVKGYVCKRLVYSGGCFRRGDKDGVIVWKPTLGAP